MSDLPDSLQRFRAAVITGPQNAVRAAGERPARPQPALRAGDYGRSRQEGLNASRDAYLRGGTFGERARGAFDLAADLTGVPAIANSVTAFRNNDPLSGATEGAMGLLGLADVAAPIAAIGARALRPVRRAAVPAAAAEEAAQRVSRPARQIGPNGMPIRESQPFRNSLRGGSADLREAAAPPQSVVARPPPAPPATPSLPSGVAMEGRNRGAGGLARYRYTDSNRPGFTYDFVVEPDAASRGGMASIQMQPMYNGQHVPMNEIVGEGTAQDAFSVYNALQETLLADARAFNRPGYYITGAGRLRDFHERLAERAFKRGALPEGYRFIPRDARNSARVVLGDRPQIAPPPTTPTGTAPFGDPRAYPQIAWEEFGSLQGGTPEARVPRRVFDLPHGDGYGTGTFEALQNPTRDQLTRLARRDLQSPAMRGVRRTGDPLDYHELRYIRDADGNIYVSSGVDVEHMHMADGLRAQGVNIGEGTRGAYGASHLQYRDGQWQIEGHRRNAQGVGESFYEPYGAAPPQPLRGGTPEARLRAQEQGYEGPFYHGTMRDVSGSFRPSLSGANGPGVYMGATPETAASYAGTPSSDGIPLQVNGRNVRMDYSRTPYGESGGNIMPLYARGPMATRDDWSAALRDAQRELRAPDQTRREVQELAQRRLQSRGYTGLRDTENDYNVIFPDADGQVRNVRSAFAAFDPARRNDPDILAGLTAAAPIPIAASALTQQQNTTGRPRGRPGFFGGR